MNKTDRARLNRILGMLGSEHDGERASAAAAAANLMRKWGLSWDDVLQEPSPPRRKHSADLGIDYAAAAQSRMRQLKAENEALHRENKRLRTRVANLSERIRQAARADAEEAEQSDHDA